MSLVGTQLGRLRIVQSLGDGGMGEVYVGFDEVLERRVAVKILRPEHRLEPETRSRFLREARILSQLQHPNICQLHDYLEREEGDVLVLELVEGKTLKEILKQGALDPRRRVAVAQQLADALVVAHERGVVHRDLKPGNIMVTSEGVLKVLDFGLARSVDEEQQTLTLGAAPGTAAPASLGPSSGTDSGRASAVRTQLGRVLGTPAYMAPEQARGEPVTAASDMYALGLLLQEIYTGRAVHEASLTVEQVLERARTADSSLPERVDRDLAALIGRLKSGVPAARPSARDTAERLRWIHRKGARRARRLAVSGAFALLVATIAVVSYQARRIGREAERANREAATAERVSEFLIGLFENADPDRRGGQVVDVLELLDAGARELRTGLEDEPIVRARMMESVGRVYLAMGRPADAADLFERSLALRDAALPDDDPAIARTVGLLSRAYRYLGRFDEALALADRELALCTARDDRLCMSDALDHQSIVYWSQGVLGRAADLSERAAAMAEEAGAPALVVATKLVNLAGSYYMMGRTSECIPVLERALEMEERELGRRHSRVANTLMNLGAIHATLGRLESADRLYREALAIQEGIHGAVHPEVALTTSNLGELALWQGRLLEAENLLRRAVATYETTLGLDHPDLLFPLATLARVYHLQGHAVEAAEAYQRALDVSRDLDDASPTKIALQEQVAAFRAGRDTLLYPPANIRPPLADAVREGDASANAATAERESGAPQR